MGVYAQLAHVKHMQRIKIPGGRVTADQLDALADVTERWGRGIAHVTTRQDIQLHYLDIEETVELQRELARAGVTTVGACADTVRNVTASHYAGVLEDEVFDVTPHAHAITQHFLFHPHNRRLPRKFKIALSGSGGGPRAGDDQRHRPVRRAARGRAGLPRLRGGRPRLDARDRPPLARFRAGANGCSPPARRW